MSNSNSKRYYWLKLNENFFEREEIKVIEDMDNGKDYIIFYMKLLLKSIGSEGKLRFRDVIPYTPKMLASITNTDIDTVQVATKMFTELGLMEIWDDGTLFMVETKNMIGSETGWAKKKRLQRAKGDIVPQLSGQCPTDIDIDKDIDIDIDKDIDIDIDKDIEVEEDSTATFKDVVQTFEENGFGTISSLVRDDLVDLVEEYSENWVLDALKESVRSNARNLKYAKAILKRWQAEGKDKGGNRNGKNRGQSKQEVDEYAGIGFSYEDLQDL